MANSLGESEATESPMAAAATPPATSTDKSPLKVVLPVRSASNGGGAETGDGASWDEDKYQRRLARAKRNARSELESLEAWWREGFYRTCDHLWQANDQVPRIDYADVSEAKFIEQFERPGLPVVIRGATDAWPARERWTLPALLTRYGSHRLKVGEDDDGHPVRLKLAYFLRYAADNIDDSPLYVFDGSFGDRYGTAPLLEDFEVPKYFRDDLFRYGSERRRPPYRWIVIGPARSGTNIHIDPLGTSAWNALLSGHKRWVLFPPGTPKAALQTPKGEGEAVNWFMKVYPKTLAPDWPHAKPIDLMQRPGETVFVPGGWWHVVLNLDMTVAVTQNFCSPTNFDRVWPRTRKGRPKFSTQLLEQLRLRRPEMHLRAVELDAQPTDPATLGGGGYGDSDSSSSSSSSSSSENEDDDDGSTCNCANCTEGAGEPSKESEDIAPATKRVRTDDDGKDSNA